MMRLARISGGRGVSPSLVIPGTTASDGPVTVMNYLEYPIAIHVLSPSPPFSCTSGATCRAL